MLQDEPMRRPIVVARGTKAEPERAIASARRTLELEIGGLAALKAAIDDGLGAAFVAAVETIRAARGKEAVASVPRSVPVVALLLRKLDPKMAPVYQSPTFIQSA